MATITKKITINLQTSRAFYLKLTPNSKKVEDYLKSQVNYHSPFHPTKIIDTMSGKGFSDMATFDEADSCEFWFADLKSCVLTVECDGKKTVYPNEKIKARPFGPLSKPVTKYKWMEKTGGTDEEWSRRCDIIDKDFALKSNDKEFKSVMKYLQKCQDEEKHTEHYAPFTVLYIKEHMKNWLSQLRSQKNSPMKDCEINDDFLYMRAYSGVTLTASVDLEIEEEFNISKFRVVRDKKWYNKCQALQNCGFDFQDADVVTCLFIYDDKIYNVDRISANDIDESLFPSIESEEDVSPVFKTVDLGLRPVVK